MAMTFYGATSGPNPSCPLQEQTFELPEHHSLENAIYSVVRRYPVRKPQPFLIKRFSNILKCDRLAAYFEVMDLK